MIDIEDLGVGFFRQLAGQTPAGICLLDRRGKCLFTNRAFEDITGFSPQELSSGPSLGFFAAPDRMVARNKMQLAETLGRQRWGARVLRPDGKQRDVNAIAIDVTAAGRKATTLVLFDVTDTLRLALKVSTINAFAQSLSTSGSIQDLLDQLSKRLVESTEALASVVLLLGSSPSRVTLAGSYGVSDAPQTWELPVSDPIWEAFERGKTRVLTHLEQSESSDGLLQRLAPALEWESVILVPLRASNKSLGVAACAYARDHDPDEAEVTFVKTLVGLAAVAVDHARLVDLAQQQAVTEERARLGRELHDSVSQTLYGIGLGAQSALEALNTDSGEAAESIDYILKLAAGGLTEMRTLLYKLRPESLAAEGLVEALRQHIGSLAERHKIALQLHLGEEPDLPLSSKHAVYRMVMEAVHNAVKHAQAETLKLSLEQRDGALSITIEDNGHGFDPSKDFSGHHGLDSMKERILSLGGQIDLESHLDVGTIVRATIPAPDNQGT